MKLSESGQEILEQLWVEEEAGRPGLTCEELPPDGLAELLQEGLVEQGSDLVRMTPTGHAEAELVIRHHRLAERLLSDVLQTEENVMSEQACRLEHVLVNGLADSICTLLGHPQFCPHGKPIPPGECCRQALQSVERVIAPLSELEVGQRGHIAYLRVSDERHAQKLMAMGVLPGVPIALLHRSPSLVFEAGYSQFAVDTEMAADIFVRLDAQQAPQEGQQPPATQRGWFRRRARRGYRGGRAREEIA
jgi:DtxR family Mn-dependent transcriptional regulator